MSVGQIIERLRREVPARDRAAPEAMRREVEAVLIAGAALPEDTPGSLRLRAHRLIRGGWKFVRCVDPACGRIYPTGEPDCQCGGRTAPLYLCRHCGADYLRLCGDPTSGPMQPYTEGTEADEWMVYDPARHESASTDDEDETRDDEEEGAGRAGRRRAPQIDRVRGQPVHDGSLDPRTFVFSSNPADYPLRVRLVHGRTRCLCCGGTAASRPIITPVALGTSAAIKVLGEGLVETLAEANRDRPQHDGKERLLVFSDSRQDAAHQARFIIFASRYDRMRRRLLQILGEHGPSSIQRVVELLGEMGIEARDNPNGPDDPERRISEDQRNRVRAYEEATLLDEIAVAPFFPGTLVNIGLLSVAYDGLEEEVRSRGEALRERLGGISEDQLIHLLRCFLDEVRVRNILSREMLRYNPQHTCINQ